MAVKFSEAYCIHLLFSKDITSAIGVVTKIHVTNHDTDMSGHGTVDTSVHCKCFSQMQDFQKQKQADYWKVVLISTK